MAPFYDDDITAHIWDVLMTSTLKEKKFVDNPVRPL